MRRLICFLIILLILFPAIGCYAHGPWRGKVIESDTKKPLEGAVVVAVWYSKLFYPWAVGGTSPEPMKVVETVTDTNGEFYFLSKYFLDIPVLREVSGPTFCIYKPGYAVAGGMTGSAPEALGLDKKEPAIIELRRAETNKYRLNAWWDADGFSSFISAYNRGKTMTPKLDELLKSEKKNLIF